MLAVENTDENVFDALVKRATVDPDWFCSDILQCPNDPWQSELMNAVADLNRARLGLPTLFNHELKSRFTIAAMHGCGKTHYLTKQMHWFNFTRRGIIPCTAPKEATLKSRTWPEFRKVLAGAIDSYKSIINCDMLKITWFNDEDWNAVIETASNPDNLAGYHHDNLLFLVEEASAVSDAMFPVIEGALTTEGAILIMIGNPTRNVGEFYNSHNKIGTKELYYKKQIKHSETKRIKQSWVDAMIRKYGRNSPVVKIRVFGEFADASPNQLLAIEWLMSAMGKQIDDGSHPKLRITCDVAAGGIDDTIIYVSLIYTSYTRIVKMLRFNFPQATAVADTREACENVFTGYNGDTNNGDDIVIDCVGVGDGAGAELVKKGYSVVRYKGGEKSDDTEAWRNRRVQSYMCYRDAYRDGNITIDEDAIDNQDLDDFYAQHISVLTKNDTEKLEDLETKKEMMSRGEKSPDMSDGGSMIFATQSPHYQGGDELTLVGATESGINEQF